jgi:hypothetical protein
LILEAFAQHLQSRPITEGKLDLKPELVLYHWVLGYLNMEPNLADPVSTVLHAEIQVFNADGHLALEGKSESGRRLLKTLYQFCRSYDHWQFSRWLHHIRASDFRRQAGS